MHVFTKSQPEVDASLLQHHTEGCGSITATIVNASFYPFLTGWFYLLLTFIAIKLQKYAIPIFMDCGNSAHCHH